MSQLVEQIQNLSPGAMVEMFELDISPITGTMTASDKIRFHAGTNGLGTSLVWQGLTYEPFPIEVEGFEVTTQGAQPRPRVRAANVTGVLTALMIGKDGLVGAKLTRRSTLVRYLDAINFPGNVNATADPTQAFLDDVYYIERKISETKFMVEWELASALDMSTAMIPARIITSTYCTWQYRGAECGYSGTNYFDANNNPVGSLSQDVCSKSVQGCKARFGNGNLPFGGFPAARMYRL